MNIYEYDNYRTYINDYYKKQKSKNSTYSYTVFARRAGLPSRGYIKLIIDGKRNLSLKTIPSISKGLGLNKTEARYFEILVQFNQAKNSVLKNDLYRQLLSFAGKKKVAVLEEAKYGYYSKWYYPVIRELVLHKNFPQERNEQASFIYRALKGKLSENEALKALETLLDLGLLIENATGKLIQKDPYISLPDETVNFALRNFQRDILQEAAKHIDDPLDKREICGVTLAIKKEDLPRAKEMIKDFRKKFNFEFSAEKDADLVYQLGIQFFDLADEKELNASDFKSEPAKDSEKSDLSFNLLNKQDANKMKKISEKEKNDE